MDIQDFDGDQLQVRLPVDKTEVKLGMQCRPDNGFFSSTQVDKCATGMILHAENISNQNNYLADNDEDNEVGIPLEQVIGI